MTDLVLIKLRVCHLPQAQEGGLGDVHHLVPVAEVEHNRWSVEELILGFRPVTDEEQEILEKDITRKREFRDRFIHYDLRAYDDLRPDANGTDVRIYDKCISAAIPLIAGTFRKEASDE